MTGFCMKDDFGLKWVIMALPYVPIATFEDKRRMNWDKGQQELERRRRELQEKEQKEKVGFNFNYITSYSGPSVCLRKPNQTSRSSCFVQNVKQNLYVKTKLYL